MSAATKLTPRKAQTFIEFLARTGNVSRAAKKAATTRDSVYKLREKSERFRKAWDDAVEQAADRLEQEAFRRGVLGWDENVYGKDGFLGVIRRYSDPLLMTLLRATRPEKFARREIAQTTLKGGLDVKNEKAPEDMTEEELKAHIKRKAKEREAQEAKEGKGE